MMLLLHALSYVAGVVAFLFCTLSLASGLLYIAELVEEHSKLAKVVGQRIIYGVCALHIVFCIVDRLPWHLSLLGIVCHLVYLSNFSRQWPFISLTSIKFIASCLLVLADHFLWFFYFAERAKMSDYNHPYNMRHGRTPWRSAWDRAPRQRNEEPLSFMDVATFFGICVWLVPFYLFLSLSANDNVLPSQIASRPGTPDLNAPANLTLKLPSHPPAQRTSMFKSIMSSAVDLLPHWSKRSSRSQREGLMPMASPVPRSAPSSPGFFGTADFFGPVSGSPQAFNTGRFPQSISSPNLSAAYDRGRLTPTLGHQAAFPPSRSGSPVPQRRSNTALSSSLGPSGLDNRPITPPNLSAGGLIGRRVVSASYAEEGSDRKAD